MIRRVISDPVVRLLLVITAILGSGFSSSHAQARLSVSGTLQLVFSTYLGGSTPCESCNSTLTFAQSAASDTQGNTYVTGVTQVSDLPVLNAYQPTPVAGSTMSAFVAKYDPSGNLVLTGLTFSSDFPLKNPAQTWPGNTGIQNAFVAKFGLLDRQAAVPTFSQWGVIILAALTAASGIWLIRRRQRS
jgi:hypothetical protein